MTSVPSGIDRMLFPRSPLVLRLIDATSNAIGACAWSNALTTISPGSTTSPRLIV